MLLWLNDIVCSIFKGIRGGLGVIIDYVALVLCPQYNPYNIEIYAGHLQIINTLSLLGGFRTQTAFGAT